MAGTYSDCSTRKINKVDEIWLVTWPSLFVVQVDSYPVCVLCLCVVDTDPVMQFVCCTGGYCPSDPVYVLCRWLIASALQPLKSGTLFLYLSVLVPAPCGLGSVIE